MSAPREAKLLGVRVGFFPRPLSQILGEAFPGIVEPTNGLKHSRTLLLGQINTTTSLA